MNKEVDRRVKNAGDLTDDVSPSLKTTNQVTTQGLRHGTQRPYISTCNSKMEVLEGPTPTPRLFTDPYYPLTSHDTHTQVGSVSSTDSPSEGPPPL